jgi:hypothetical protein
LYPYNSSVLRNCALANLALGESAEAIFDCDRVIAGSIGNFTDTTTAIVRSTCQRRSEARLSSSGTSILEIQSELNLALQYAESALKFTKLFSL